MTVTISTRTEAPDTVLVVHTNDEEEYHFTKEMIPSIDSEEIKYCEIILDASIISTDLTIFSEKSRYVHHYSFDEYDDDGIPNFVMCEIPVELRHSDCAIYLNSCDDEHQSLITRLSLSGYDAKNSTRFVGYVEVADRLSDAQWEWMGYRKPECYRDLGDFMSKTIIHQSSLYYRRS